MRKTLLSLALFLSLAPLHGQKMYHDLSNLKPMENWPWHFAIDSIIDAREDKAEFGYILSKRGKTKTPVYHKQPVLQDLNRLLKVGDRIESTPAYLLRINHLFTYEVMVGRRPKAVTDVNVSFIRKHKNGYTEVFQAMATISEKGKDATSWVGYTVEKALLQCFDDFEKRNTLKRLNPIPLTEDNIDQNPYGERVYPIQQAQNRKKILYFNLYDMRDNVGDTTTRFYPDVRYNRDDKAESATIDIPDNKEMQKSVFGFSDGKTVFIKVGRSFVPLKMRNGDLTIDRYEQDNSAAIASMIIGGVTGGFIGFAIASAINPIENVDFWIIDFDRGTIIPNTKKNVKEISAQTLIYNSNYNQSTDTLMVSVNDSVVCQLLPNQYYNCYTGSKTDSIKVCVELKGAKTCETITPQLFDSEIYVARSKRNGELDLGTLKGNAKSELYRDLRDGRLERVMP